MVAVVPLVAVIVVLLALVFVAKNLLYVAAPNQVIVLSGSARRVGNRTVGYRAIRGGRALRIPLLERVDWVDLSNIVVGFDSFEVATRGGLRVRVDLVAHVCLPGEQPRLDRALECLLDKSRAEIIVIARRVLMGVLIGVAAAVRPEHMAEAPASFEQTLMEEAETQLARIGLVLDRVRMGTVKDAHGYLDALGKSET